MSMHSCSKTGNGTVRCLIVKSEFIFGKRTEKVLSLSAKVIAKSTITEKRQGKRRGCPTKKNLKSAIRIGK